MMRLTMPGRMIRAGEAAVLRVQKSCRITIHSTSGMAADSMVDWHQYDKDTVLTAFRLHTAYTMYKPAPPRGGYVKLAEHGQAGRCVRQMPRGQPSSTTFRPIKSARCRRLCIWSP